MLKDKIYDDIKELRLDVEDNKEIDNYGISVEKNGNQILNIITKEQFTFYHNFANYAGTADCEIQIRDYYKVYRFLNDDVQVSFVIFYKREND